MVGFIQLEIAVFVTHYGILQMAQIELLACVWANDQGLLVLADQLLHSLLELDFLFFSLGIGSILLHFEMNFKWVIHGSWGKMFVLC